MANDTDHPTLPAALAATRNLHRWATGAGHHLDLVADALSDLTPDERRALGEHYPRLMAALLIIEDNYGGQA